MFKILFLKFRCQIQTDMIIMNQGLKTGNSLKECLAKSLKTFASKCMFYSSESEEKGWLIIVTCYRNLELWSVRFLLSFTEYPDTYISALFSSLPQFINKLNWQKIQWSFILNITRHNLDSTPSVFSKYLKWNFNHDI